MFRGFIRIVKQKMRPYGAIILKLISWVERHGQIAFFLLVKLYPSFEGKWNHDLHNINRINRSKTIYLIQNKIFKSEYGYFDACSRTSRQNFAWPILYWMISIICPHVSIGWRNTQLFQLSECMQSGLIGQESMQCNSSPHKYEVWVVF